MIGDVSKKSAVEKTSHANTGSITRKLPWRRVLRQGLLYLAVLGLLAIALLPFYWIVNTSIKPTTEQLRIPPTWFPIEPTLDNFVKVWSFVPMAMYMVNSLWISLGTTVVALVIALPAGYALSRYEFRGNIMLLMMLLFTQMVPAVVTLIPFYFLTRTLGLHNSRTGLVLSYAAWSVPFATLMMRSYLKTSYPRDLEDSALIDGCTRFGAFIRIVLPLSAPGIAATGAFAFLLSWNEYLWASVIITDRSLKTLPLGLRDFVGQFGVNPYLGLWMTAAVLATLPVVILFLWFQRYMVGGLVSGAIRG